MQWRERWTLRVASALLMMRAADEQPLRKGSARVGSLCDWQCTQWLCWAVAQQDLSARLDWHYITGIFLWAIRVPPPQRCSLAGGLCLAAVGIVGGVTQGPYISC